jgi:surfactin synthase thioesterase subunit
MSVQTTKLFLFPGLGADERLFTYQMDNFDSIVVPEWIPPLMGENLSEYCERWAQRLEIGAQDFIGGMSFGGQVALELAKHIQCQGCLLISANRSSSEISTQFRMQNKVLQSMPEAFVRSSLKNIAIPFLVKSEKLHPAEKEILTEMLEEMDFEFFKWSSNAAAEWQYEFNPDDFKTPIHQLHGEKDNIITIKDRSHVDVLKEASHLINFTHAKEVNQWIREKISPSF